MPVRPFSIGPAFGVHLEHAEINAQLNLLLAVSTFEFPNNNLAGLIRPLFEEWRNVKIHAANMAANRWQVNERLVLYVYFGDKQACHRSSMSLFTPANSRNISGRT